MAQALHLAPTAHFARDSPSSLNHAGDEGHESHEGHEGDEEGHEAQGNEGCRRGGTHESHESDEGHEGDEEGDESHESHEGHESDEESHESHEGHEGNEGYEEVKCGGEKCDLSSLLVGDGHEECLVALEPWRGASPGSILYKHW